jgi:replicative DNA helicase
MRAFKQPEPCDYRTQTLSVMVRICMKIAADKAGPGSRLPRAVVQKHPCLFNQLVFTNEMYTTQAKMRLSCSARSSSSCLLRSFQQIFHQQRSTFAPCSKQQHSSLFIAAAARPGQQQLLAGSRTWQFSSTPSFIVRSGDGEGATDSMESKCTTLPRQR